MTRPHTTAQGTPYVTDWRDHTSYARRAHTHGPLRSLYDEGRAIGFPFWRGLGAVTLVLATLAGLWVMLP